MRRYDVFACAFVVAAGLVWFAAAEVVYDGSLMEDPFLRSGMLAQLFVPLATMYLVKAILGEGRCSAIVAWLLSFLVLWTLIAVDVWVTHFKPDCDICHIPANECLMMESVAAIIITVLASVSDVLVMQWIRKISYPFASVGLIRRVVRLVGTVLLTWLLSIFAYWVLYAIASIIRLFMK